MRYHSPLMSYRVQIIATSWMSCEIIILNERRPDTKGYQLYDFHFYEISRVDKSIETESGFVVARLQRQGKETDC